MTLLYRTPFEEKKSPKKWISVTSWRFSPHKKKNCLEVLRVNFRGSMNNCVVTLSSMKHVVRTQPWLGRQWSTRQAVCYLEFIADGTGNSLAEFFCLKYAPLTNSPGAAYLISHPWSLQHTTNMAWLHYHSRFKFSRSIKIRL
jgi:hypothetical protein